MDGPELMVPLLAIFCIFGLPVIAWVSFRVMAHRERMEMLRQGFVPGEGKVPWTPGAPAAQSRPIAASEFAPDGLGGTLRKGITVTMIGFALTLGLSFIGFDDGSAGWHPGPWLLGGLVPMFVGLAQVIIALMAGATLGPGPVWRMQTGAPPPRYSEPIPPPAGAQTYDGSYTYRPGATQELRPPNSPPERR